MAKLAYWFVLFVILALAKTHGVNRKAAPSGLMCEHRASPSLGIHVFNPRFSWIPPHLSECDGPNQLQHSFHLQVAFEPTFATLLWDSQRVVSSDTIHYSPAKLELSSAVTYYWRVKTWSTTGMNTCESSWSSYGKFTTSLLQGFGRESKPIWNRVSSRYTFFRKDVVLGKVVTSAITYVTASSSGSQEKLLGAYRLYVNGVTAGIGPGRGDVYVKDIGHAVYDTIDVTDLVKGGKLNLALQCYHSDGKGNAKVLLEMQITFADASKLVLSTDETWLAFDAQDLFNPSVQSTGGAYDAPQENINGSSFPGQASWMTDPITEAGRGWQAAVAKSPFVSLKPKPALPISFAFGISPTAMEQVAAGHYFFDFGEEMMGGIRIALPAPVPGGLYLQLTLSEELAGAQHVLYPMRTGNHYRNVWSTGVGSHDKRMVMEHHEYMLFRYGELKISKSPGEEHRTSIEGLNFSLTAWRVRYPWSEDDSHFHSSNDMLNKVWKLCRDTLRITSLDSTTDSNTRERLPYEADGAITGSSRYVFQREYLWQRHSAAHNFLNPTWPTEWRQFMPLIAYADYMQTGDLSLFKDFYPLLFNSSQASCINGTTNLIDFSKCSRSCNDGKSDCRDNIDWPPDTRDGYVLNDVSTVINAFAVQGLRVLSTMANATGEETLAEKLLSTSDKITMAMNEKLWDDSAGLFIDGLGSTQAENHSAWHAQTNPLWAGKVVPPTRHSTILKFLKQKRMAGSVYGAYAFLLALYEMDFDHGKFALEMMTSCDESSWCHMLKVGATATMEAWSRKQKPNLSWSHPWATAPATAIAQGFMGLKPLMPKYARFLFKPQPGDAMSGAILLPTFSGPIRASFQVTLGVSFVAKLQPPANTLARACLPKGSFDSVALIVDGKKVQGFAEGDYVCVDGIGSSSQDRVIERRWSTIYV